MAVPKIERETGVVLIRVFVLFACYTHRRRVRPNEIRTSAGMRYGCRDAARLRRRNQVKSCEPDAPAALPPNVPGGRGERGGCARPAGCAHPVPSDGWVNVHPLTSVRRRGWVVGDGRRRRWRRKILFAVSSINRLLARRRPVPDIIRRRAVARTTHRYYVSDSSHSLSLEMDIGWSSVIQISFSRYHRTRRTPRWPRTPVQSR